jgi:hypothetical protein
LKKPSDETAGQTMDEGAFFSQFPRIFTRSHLYAAHQKLSFGLKPPLLGK